MREQLGQSAESAPKAFDAFPEGRAIDLPVGPKEGSNQAIEGDDAMKAERFEVVRGSGNVYRDLRKDNPDLRQFKAILATEIIKALDRDRLTVRKAHARTGIAAADFSRIRNADLGRFTVDRLMSIINRLGSRVEVAVTVKRSTAAQQASIV